MICTQCGKNLHEVGIDEYVLIPGSAEMVYNPDTNTWQFTGESDTYWDANEHKLYACSYCRGPLTDEQESAISLD